jgi:hypothetical protein
VRRPFSLVTSLGSEAVLRRESSCCQAKYPADVRLLLPSPAIRVLSMDLPTNRGLKGVPLRERFRNMRVIWEHGKTWERFSVVILWGTVAFIFLSVGVVLVWPFSYYAGLAYAWAVLAGGLVMPTLLGGMFNAATLRVFLQRGSFGSREPYYAELVRFLETRGEDGRLPGAVWWLVAGWVVFYGTIAATLVLSLDFVPVWGRWTPFVFLTVDLAVDVGYLVAYLVRMNGLFRAAESEGYKLLQLGRRM